MFELPSDYTYIFLTLPFLIIWLIIYLRSKSTRNEQVLFSYAGAIVGPLSEIIYFRDYWLPKSALFINLGNFPLMLEDILFGFAIGGIAAVIFEVVFRMRLKRLSFHSKHVVKGWAIVLLFGLALTIFLAIGLNSIFASALAFIITTLPILFYRKDLLLDAVGSGFCVMIVMFVCYYILFNLASNTEFLMKEQWLIYGTSLDLRFAGIPLTEMAWGFTWGFLAGPLYEFLLSKRLVLTRKRF
jgi:hypothetical protein